MNYLSLENVSKSFGEKVLFDEISLTISKGQKIALIAKNGSGKTTLLRVIAGEEAPEGVKPNILIHPSITVGYLPQEPFFHDDSTVLEAALNSDTDEIVALKSYEQALIDGNDEQINKALTRVDQLGAWDIEAKLKETLGKVNLHDLHQKVGTLSGGQKKRLALVKLMMTNPDFLILDEPTNHLDIAMIEWLEKYLASQQISLFMVTHDRYFLERVCNEIIELDRGELHLFKGNYSNYLEKKALMMQSDSSRLDKMKQLYKKELNWIRRQPKARGTKAKSRVVAFDKIKEEAHKTVDSPLTEIAFEPRRLGTKILELHHVSKAFGDINIVEDFSYKFKKGEKVGIAGPNGIGKTSFIKLFTKELRPDSGKVVLGDTVEFGHYNQDGIQLGEDKTVIQVIRDIADYIPLKKGYKLTAEQLLERFLFPRPQQQVFVSKLSGGEKRRLLLLRVLMTNPNFLILDEPTNDLDVVTLNIIEDYLIQFPGCVIVISHDRYFMDKIVDHMFILEGGGQIKDFNGSYSAYKNQKAAPAKIANVQTGKKPKKQQEQNEVSDERKLSYFEKKEYKDLPNEIDKLEKEKKDIEAKFLDTTLSSEQISELSKRLGEINKIVDEKETRWLELAEFM